MMKKLLPLLLMLLTLATAACAEEIALPAFEWERDGQTHWQLAEDGAPINQGDHEIGDDLICTVCGSEVLDWGDGCIDVTDYDEYGNTLRYSSFESGEKTYDAVHAIVVNEDGVVLEDREFQNGQLASETIYAVDADGMQQTVKATFWDAGVLSSVNEYDEYGNCIRTAYCTEDGEFSMETLSEFAQNEDGDWYERRTITRFGSGETFLSEYNQYGDTTLSQITDAEGNLLLDATYEYEYDGGVMLWSKQYDQGQLVYEEYCTEDGLTAKTVEYVEDGAVTVTMHNENGDPILATTTAVDGSILSEAIFTYVYSETGDQLESRMFVDGVLAEEAIYHYDEELGFTGLQRTIWHEDGSRTVEDYDDFFDLIRSTVYDADGNVVSVEGDTVSLFGVEF